jgi:hypothetical protein
MKKNLNSIKQKPEIFSKSKIKAHKTLAKDCDALTTTTKPSMNCLDNILTKNKRKDRTLRLSERATRKIVFDCNITTFSFLILNLDSFLKNKRIYTLIFCLFM